MNTMTSLRDRRLRLLRRILRAVLLLVMAEAVTVGLGWCLSPQGRAFFARLFRRRRPDNDSTIVDV